MVKLEYSLTALVVVPVVQPDPCVGICISEETGQSIICAVVTGLLYNGYSIQTVLDLYQRTGLDEISIAVAVSVGVVACIVQLISHVGGLYLIPVS